MADKIPVRICLVEDEPTIRETLTQLFLEEGSLELLRSFATGEAAMQHLEHLAPQVVIMDISLPGRSGIECVRELAPLMPDTRFLMYTMHDDDHRVFDALKAGAEGYILKSSSSQQIINAVHELMANGAPMSSSVARRVIGHFRARPVERDPGLAELSEREINVLDLLAEGLLYKEIGERLGISTNTVGQHVHRIYGKLHVQNRTEALNKYLGR